MKKLMLSSIISIGFLFAVNISAQTKVRVKFAKGANSATLQGSIAGYKYTDYIFTAKAGQTASVNSKSSNANLEYLIYDGAMNIIEDLNDGGGASSNVLPAAGNYTVRVILPRSEARRKGAQANFSLTISVE